MGNAGASGVEGQLEGQRDGSRKKKGGLQVEQRVVLASTSQERSGDERSSRQNKRQKWWLE